MPGHAAVELQRWDSDSRVDGEAVTLGVPTGNSAVGAALLEDAVKRCVCERVW